MIAVSSYVRTVNTNSLCGRNAAYFNVKPGGIYCNHWTLKPLMLLSRLLVCFWRNSIQWARASSFTRFVDHTQRRNTVGRTPLDEWSARRRDLYLTTHSTHNRQTFIQLVGFEPTISAGEWPQTYALERAATGIGSLVKWYMKIINEM